MEKLSSAAIGLTLSNVAPVYACPDTMTCVALKPLRLAASPGGMDTGAGRNAADAGSVPTTDTAPRHTHISSAACIRVDSRRNDGREKGVRCMAYFLKRRRGIKPAACRGVSHTRLDACARLTSSCARCTAGLRRAPYMTACDSY